jgi:TRAP-type C4-dicarboxylate transport system permease small subunit
MKTKNWTYYLNEICTLIGSGMFILLTIICFMQIILRYAFSAAQDWPEEATRFLFIWTAYLGMAYAMYANKHLKVDIIDLLISKRMQSYMEIVGQLVSLVFMWIIAWKGWGLIAVVIESEEVALTLPVPLYIVWFSIPFTFALTGIYCLNNIRTVATGLKTED